MSQQQKIHVKLQHNNEFRRFIIEPQFKFNELHEKISTLLHLTTPFSIRYLDEESEWITIETDNELLTGIELSPALLRLKIEPTTPTVPTSNPDTVEEKSCKKWRKCNKRGECDDTVSEEKGCKRRKWRKESEMNGTDESEKKWRKWREENCDEKSDGEKKCRGNWRKWREENGETLGEKKCGKWRKWREENGEKDEEGKGRGGRRCPRGAWGGPRGRGAWRKFHGMDSDSDSAEETRPVEEIKKEVNSLKEEIGALVNKKKGLWEELVVLRTQIKNLRQNEGTSDEILKVREEIMEKKRVVREYHVQIANSKNRIWKLKSALVMRVDTN